LKSDVARKRIAVETVADTSVKALLEKASDCLEIAKGQHRLAEKQFLAAHQLDASADKLEGVGCALEASAAEITALRRKLSC
jgi:hypothetical protein